MNRHKRLLIVPPSDDDIDKAGSLYPAWCVADWVPAEARPDLDPVNNTEADSQRARELASPMAMFGLRPPTPDLHVDGEHGEDTTRLEGAGLGPDDRSEGYGPACDADPMGLGIGDLVELEPGHWVTLDEEPEEDPTDPSAVLLCWRDDEDDTGIHSLGSGEMVTARQTHLEFAA